MKTKQGLRWARVAFACGLLLRVAGCGGNTQPRTQGETPRQESWSTSGSAPGGGRYDLSRDQERGGHTLQKHVGRSDEELRLRLDRERDISAASTWTDRDAAEQTVGEALQAERGRIQSWEDLGYPRANLALHFNAGRVIGRSMRHTDSQSSPCTQAVIVLKAEGAHSFYVLTTYPEERE
jgi:hypothetical protein